jgi:hypothetical protein
LTSFSSPIQPSQKITFDSKKQPAYFILAGCFVLSQYEYLNDILFPHTAAGDQATFLPAFPTLPSRYNRYPLSFLKALIL